MTLIGQLNALETSGLIRLAAAQPDLEYLFRHALIQDAAYASLVKADRMHLHLTAGETLERLYPENRERLASQLARHFYEAGDDERALQYLTLAGDAAYGLYANAEAVTQYTHALQVAPRATHLPDASHIYMHLYMRRGRALELSARYDEALANYDEMGSVARQHGDRSLELSALIARAMLHSSLTPLHDAKLGQTLSEQALSLARDLNDRAAEAKTLWNLMLLNTFIGRASEGVIYGEQSLAIARELDLREQLAFTLNDLGRAYSETGQFDRSGAALHEARALWRALGNLPMLAENLSSAASSQLYVGQYDQAVTLAAEALGVSQAIDNLWGQSYSREIMAYVYLDRGEYAQGIREMEEAIRLGEQAGSLEATVGAPIMLASVYGWVGAVDRGIEVAQRALAHAEAHYPEARSGLWVVLSLLHVVSGHTAEAETALAEVGRSTAAGLPPTSGMSFLPFEFLLALARQDPAQVVAAADKMIAFFERGGMLFMRTDALYYKGRALLTQGRREEAHQALAQARATAEALGARRILWQVLLALGQIEGSLGNIAEADRLRAEAREIIDYIAGHMGSSELRTAFLNLPDVRTVIGGT